MAYPANEEVVWIDMLTGIKTICQALLVDPTISEKERIRVYDRTVKPIWASIAKMHVSGGISRGSSYNPFHRDDAKNSIQTVEFMVDTLSKLYDPQPIKRS